MEENFTFFMSDFEDKFIEFFSSQCSNYDYALDVKETKKVAKEILDNLFVDKIYMSLTSNAVIAQMKKDGVFVGFLINKVFLYTLENYLLFLQKENSHNFGYLEKLVQIFSRFSHLFENYIKMSLEDRDGVISFGDNNYIFSRNNILDIFKNIKKENKSIEFMNLYQGYPIKGAGKIVDIDDEDIVFKLDNELQEIAMKLEGKAYILKDRHFNRHVKADIVYSNFSNSTIVLNNFIYLLNLPAMQRNDPRIYPKILIHAKLVGNNNLQVDGNLYDLSQNGIGMISEENLGFYNGIRINIEFNLTYDERKYLVKTTGEIVDIMQYMKSYRYCIKIFPDEKNKIVIKKYTEKREEEIKQELRDELACYIF